MSVFRKLAGKYAAMGIVVGDTAKAVAVAVEKELEAGFAQGKDAYGNQWEPLATGGSSHLRETGAYQASLDVFAVPGIGHSLIEMRTNNAANLHARRSEQRPPGSYLEKRSHKSGAAKRVPMQGAGAPWIHPARPLMPISGQPLPPKWSEIIGDSFSSELSKVAK